MSFMSRPPLARGARVRQQGYLTGVLDRGRNVALVLGAVAGYPAGTDLSAVGNELPQQSRVLVVDVGDLVVAEQANLLLRLAQCRLCHRGAPFRAPPQGGNGLGLWTGCV